VGGGEKIELQKKLRSGLRKGKQKKSTWDDTGKENPIHVGALVGAGSLGPFCVFCIAHFVFPFRGPRNIGAP